MSSVLMRGKKGAAHFEMIFSIVFFVGFVFFLFLVLKPQDTSTLSGSVIAALYDSFEDKAYTNLSSVFLRADYEAGETSCFKIELPGRIFAYAINDEDSYVTDLDGVKANSDLKSSASGGDLKVQKTGNFFRVSISPEFNDSNMGDCDFLDSYQLGSIVERRVISYSALQEMSERYRTDYEGLKADLRLPGIFDFAIAVENMSSVNMEPQFGVPEGINVIAQDYVVEVLKKDGKLTNERFILKIW
jgi:hypothetical protein